MDKKVIKEMCKVIKQATKDYKYSPETSFLYTEDDHTYVLTAEEESRLSFNQEFPSIELPEEV